MEAGSMPCPVLAAFVLRESDPRAWSALKEVGVEILTSFWLLLGQDFVHIFSNDFVKISALEKMVLAAPDLILDQILTRSLTQILTCIISNLVTIQRVVKLRSLAWRIKYIWDVSRSLSPASPSRLSSRNSGPSPHVTYLCTQLLLQQLLQFWQWCSWLVISSLFSSLLLLSCWVDGFKWKRLYRIITLFPVRSSGVSGKNKMGIFQLDPFPGQFLTWVYNLNFKFCLGDGV